MGLSGLSHNLLEYGTLSKYCRKLALPEKRSHVHYYRRSDWLKHVLYTCSADARSMQTIILGTLLKKMLI